MGAVLVAAAMVLAGCTTDDGVDQVSTTTNPSVTEQPGNPWDLPLEQRPPLFDPCEEIPIEAVEEALDADVEPSDRHRNDRPGELFSCGWNTGEALLGVVGTWRPRDQFRDDPELEISEEAAVRGRPSLVAVDKSDAHDSSCYRIFFTSRGAVVVNVVLLKTMGQYRGERFVKSCDVLADTIDSLVSYIPGGDF